MSTSPQVAECQPVATAADNNDAKQGKTYEKLLFTLLAKKGHELSNDGKFKDGNFSVGRELGMELDAKFDDICFSYKGMDDTKNLVFVQVKHKQDESQMIDYKILSTEEWSAKGHLCEDFNLQKYFISFLRMREELENATSEERKDGKIKYVAIYTNTGLNTENLDLKGNDDDDSLNHIKSVFSFEKSPIDCYQLNSLSDELHSVLEKSSDLHRIARELAQCVVWENYRKRNILGKDETAVNLYQVALEKYVIEKSPGKMNMGNEEYCVAKFRKDFIENYKPGPKKELRDTIFEKMGEFDKTKINTSDDELKEILRGVELKATLNFGKTKHKRTELPCKWMAVKKEDIDDFLKCFVLLVNQPNEKDLTQIFLAKQSILRGSPTCYALDNFYQKLRDRIEKELGIYEKGSHKEMWLSKEQVIKFIQELEEAVNISVNTLYYEDRVLKYGKFSDSGRLAAILDSFLCSEKREKITDECHLLLKESKILNVCSEMTLLSAIKIFQHLNTKNNILENGKISIDLDELIEMKDRVEKAFSSETYKLLIIECRHKVNKQNIEDLCESFTGIIKSNPSKKIILISKQSEPDILDQKFRYYLKKLFQRNCDPEKLHVQEYDDLNLTSFVPEQNPLENEVIVFQGEKEKISLAKLLGFEDWHSFVDYLSQHKILNKVDVADIMIKILNNHDIEVGSKPPGISSLEGAYAELFEEINLNSLLHALLDAGNKALEDDGVEDISLNIFEETYSDTSAQNLEDVSNEVYIFDGISGLNKNEKKDKLIVRLGLVNKQEMIENLFGDIGSDKKIQITDDQFNDKTFKQICCDNPNRKIFWIYVKDEENKLVFILQKIYNHTFYFKRNFKIPKKVIIGKDVKEQLVNEFLSELFIFQCLEGQQEFVKLLRITDLFELRQFQVNCEKGKIKLCKIEDDAKNIFEDCHKRNETVHWLKLEKDQIIWCKSNGSLNKLQFYIDHNQCKMSLVKEDDLFKEIKDRRVVILADEPGMGKTTTLTKLYELKNKPETFTETSWIIRINLKDHLEAIRDMKVVNGNINLDSVVAFLSEMDVKLSHSLSKSLLGIALANNKIFLKSLFLAFDGFDEILDPKDRNKIITLLKFLNEKTAAKLWITTRLHYKRTLENELLTFAVALDPMTDDIKESYIETYLKDRLYLILCQDKFTEFFSNNDEIQESRRIFNYTKIFIKKMKLIFKYGVSTFIGTPLQLYLMLEDSINHIKSWIENKNKNLSFDYLGNDEREIYKTFLERKYSIYFKKMGIKEGVRQKEDKFIFTQYSKDFSKLLILKSKPKKALEKFKDIVLSAGIIKFNGSNIGFIHATFRDYFAAKVFVHWIKEVPNELSNSLKHEFVLKEILKKPDYQLIRTFINLKLKKIADPELQNSFIHYGKIAEKLLLQQQSPFIDEEGTVLHVASKEGNTEIAWFLLKCIKEHKDVLEKILLECSNKHGETALHLASCRNYYEIVMLLLDAAEEISEDTLQKFLYKLDNTGYNALDEAVFGSSNQISKELLKRANNKLDLIQKEDKFDTSVYIACDLGNVETLRMLFEEFDDDSSRKQLLLSKCGVGNALFRSVSQIHLEVDEYSSTIVEYVLSIAKSIKDNNQTLKKLLLPEEMRDLPLYEAIEKQQTEVFKIILNETKSIDVDNEMLKKTLLPEEFLPLNDAVEKGNICIVKMILNTAKDIDDDNYTLKELLYNRCLKTKIFPLVIATEMNHYDIVELLLEEADSLDNEIVEKLILNVIKDGKLNVTVNNNHEEICVGTFKILKEDKHKRIRKKIVKIYDSIPITNEFESVTEQCDKDCSSL